MLVRMHCGRAAGLEVAQPFEILDLNGDWRNVECWMFTFHSGVRETIKNQMYALRIVVALLMVF